MSLFSNIADLLIYTLFSTYILFVWLRFLMQLVRADFYDPFAQFIVKATGPTLQPLRRIVPSLGGMDVAALLLIVGLRMLELGVLAVVHHEGASMTLLTVEAVGSLLLDACVFYRWVIVIRAVLSWIAPGAGAPGAVLVYQLSEPLMQPVRRMLPSMGMLDLSAMVVFVLLQIFSMLVAYAFGHLLLVMGG